MEAAEITAGQAGAVRPRLRPRLVSAIEAADVIGQESAAMHEHTSSAEKRSSVPPKIETPGGQRGLERIADQVVQVVTSEALDGLEHERVQDHRGGEVRRRLPERIEAAVAERAAQRVRIDHGAAEPERQHREPSSCAPPASDPEAAPWPGLDGGPASARVAARASFCSRLHAAACAAGASSRHVHQRPEDRAIDRLRCRENC